MNSKKQKLFSEQAWQRGFSALKKFKGYEGHCRVPRFHLEGKFKLGQWVAVQRYTKDDLTAERRTRLNKLGFIWSRRDWFWERGFAALKAFKTREGHCLVPALHIEGDLKLGYWVSTQRRKKNIMSKERKQRLNKIGFVWQPRKLAK
ncbi:MAG: helicase associated domain-containing protein [Pseudolabrys sp.]